MTKDSSAGTAAGASFLATLAGGGHNQMPALNIIAGLLSDIRDSNEKIAERTPAGEGPQASKRGEQLLELQAAD